MKSITYDVVIIGAGPAGVTFYYKLQSQNFKNALLVDKNFDYCSSIKNYGIFRRNLNAQTIKEYDNLFDNTKKGIDVYNFFHQKYGEAIKVVPFFVDNIEKQDDFFCLKDTTGNVIKTRSVVLATGLERKLLKILPSSDITLLDKYAIQDMADKNNSEIIFIGSGDNVAVKSIAICGLYKNDLHKLGRVRIIARPFFFEKTNPLLHKDLKYFQEEGILEINYTEEDILDFEYTWSGLVHKIIFEKTILHTKNFSSALVGIYIGFKKTIPRLTNCSEKDLLLIGDINSMNTGKAISLTDAVYSAEVEVKKIIN